jgi:translation initiation factor 2 subunit 1
VILLEYENMEAFI